ncbi:hypothetical protein D8B21_22335, partial [Verminephrobacter aporrectodeae subsp. tuberculatae]|uniref:hypothetical protein n=1 Tax=Verminephrobacter aporrectodeae TaxID=1110389 RepID=UPI0022449ECA
QAAAADQAIPWQIGVPRSLAATATAQGTRAQLRWQPAPGGMQLGISASVTAHFGIVTDLSAGSGVTRLRL